MTARRAFHTALLPLLLAAVPAVVQAQDAGPGARVGHRVAYHAGLEMVVVFGGRDADGADRNDLWGWDGSRWRLLNDGADGPAPRSRHAMGYDRARDRIVIHGGGTVDRDLGDAWAWSRDGWTRLPDGGPGPRSHHQMSYDPGARAMLLYGGGRDADGFGSDLWTLDGDRWTPAGRLRPGRVLAAMVPADDGVLLYGGLVRGGPRSRELWRWRDGRWSLVDVDGPIGALSPGLARDRHTGELVLFGGEDGDGLVGGAWVRGPDGWTRDTGAGPPARTEHAMVYDEARQAIVVYGGRTADGPTAEVWERDERGWRRIR